MSHFFTPWDGSFTLFTIFLFYFLFDDSSRAVHYNAGIFGD